jgi:hypothetical protein
MMSHIGKEDSRSRCVVSSAEANLCSVLISLVHDATGVKRWKQHSAPDKIISSADRSIVKEGRVMAVKADSLLRRGIA